MDDDELVGRADALAAIARAFVEADGTGHALLVDGESGIGKSACLAAGSVLGRERGHLVVESAGNSAETHLAYAGLHRLLRPLLTSLSELPPARRAALADAIGAGDGTTADPLTVCLATLDLLRAAAGSRGLLVVVDDLHALDERSRQVIVFLARRLERREVVLVAASHAWRRTAVLGDTFRGVHLDRLDDADAHRVVGRHGAALSRPRRLWVVAHAAGNPLALTELARTAGWVGGDGRPEDRVPTLTPRLERAFAAGLSSVTGTARETVLVAAVASEPRLQEILAATGGLTGEPVTAAVLEPAQALGLLRVDDTWVRFSHPLVAAAVLQREPVSHRQRAHRALGDVVTVSASRRAWHRALGAAGRDDAVAAELDAISRDSVRRGATTAAVKGFERAAELTSVPSERSGRLVRAARHAARLGQPDVVRRLLEAVEPGSLSDPDRLRVELLQADRAGAVVGDGRQIARLCRAADRALATGESDLALELAEAAVRRRCASPVEGPALTELRTLARRMVTGSEGAGALAVLALADPVAHGREVLERLGTVDAGVTDADAASACAVAARAVGDYPTASRLLDRAEVPLRARGLLGPLARNLAVAADLRLELGEWDRAAAALTGFAALASAAMSPSHRASALTTAARLTALRGDVGSALELLAEAEFSPAARSGSRFLARAQIARAVAWTGAGRHDDAFAAVVHVFDPHHPTHHFREQWDAVSHLADSAAHSGRHDRAARVVDRLRPVAAVSGSPVLAAQLAYADAVLAADGEAEEHFLAALADGCGGSRWLRARLQLAYGRWLRRDHRVNESRTPLAASVAGFDRLGAVTWSAQANDELAATGVRAAPRAEDPVLRLLSAQETRIAHLAAQGLSNKDIGAQLYLSPRTVGSHLYRIFPKLGVSTRAQLAGRLGGTAAGVAAAAPPTA